MAKKTSASSSSSTSKATNGTKGTKRPADSGLTQPSMKRFMLTKPADNVGPAQMQPAQTAPESSEIERPVLRDVTNSANAVHAAPSSAHADDFGSDIEDEVMLASENAVKAKEDPVDDFGSDIDDELMLESVNGLTPSKSNGGNSTKLTLAAVLLHAFQVVIAFAIDNVKDCEYLRDVLGAEYFVDLVLRGMPTDLVSYLESCIVKGIAWDVRVVAKLLHPREKSYGKHGCYLVQLLTGYIHEYVGASWAVTTKGIGARLDQHFDPEYRSESVSYFYNIWDSAKHPVQKALAGALCFLPVKVAATYGPAPILLVEVVLTGLMTPVGDDPNTAWSKLSALIHPHLLELFRSYAGLPIVSLNASSKLIMEAALSKAAEQSVRATNKSLPIFENHFGRKVAGASRLATPGGALCKARVDINRDTLEFKLSKHAPAFDIQRYKQFMLKDGFSMDRPYLTMTIELADQYDPDNYAQVSENNGTPSNLLGYELAHRVLVRLSYVRADDSVGTFLYTRGKQGLISELERACFAMSLYDYSIGNLPRDDFGRRRRDLDKSSTAAKAWDKDAPEMVDVTAADERPFECKGCFIRFGRIESVRQHLGLYNVSYSTSQDCRDKSGMHSAAQVTPETCRVHGSVLPVPELPGSKSKTRGSSLSTDDKPFECKGCGVRFTQMKGVRLHLGFLKGSQNPNIDSCREKSSMHTAADVTEEACLVKGMSAPVAEDKVLKFRCLGCHKTFTTFKLLSGHLCYTGTQLKQYGVSQRAFDCRKAYGELTGKDDPKLKELSTLE